jgi:hypothetical protein
MRIERREESCVGSEFSPIKKTLVFTKRRFYQLKLLFDEIHKFVSNFLFLFLMNNKLLKKKGNTLSHEKYTRETTTLKASEI